MHKHAMLRKIFLLKQQNVFFEKVTIFVLCFLK